MNKIKKTTTNNNGNNASDKISNLSEELLVTIVSLLPFKEAARTCILSKKWRNIWLQTENIEFDENFFVWFNEESEESKEKHRLNFIDFSKLWCRQYRGKTIQRFRLVFSNPQANDIANLQGLLKFAIDRKVKFLELDFSSPSWDENSLDNHDPVFELPSFVYEHRDLVSLKLYSCKFNAGEFKNPRGIKNLSLGWTNLSSSGLNGFLTRCSFLEGLSLKKCWKVGGLSISTPRLRSLVLDKCLDLGDAIDIDARKMNYFKYSGGLIYFTIEYLSTMEVAEIDFALEEEFCANGYYLYNILNELWSSKRLSVCSYLLQVIPYSEEEPNLECVRHLVLKTGLHIHEFYGISYLLKCCPYLENLTIDLSTPKIYQDLATDFRLEEHPFLIAYKYESYGPLFKCLETLKVVEIKGFKGEHHEIKAIKYFITYGTALDNVCITLSSDKGPYGMDVKSTYRLKAQTLLTCRRASRALKFSIKN